MDLDKLAVEIRPRKPWEAADLGLLMAKRWWWPLTKIWLVMVVPLFLLLSFLPLEWLWLQYTIIWWLKPIFERALLDFMSLSVFGDEPSTRRVFNNVGRVAFRQFFASLLWRRLSPSRSFDLPVIQLEGLAGGERAARMAVLHREGTSQANSLTMYGASIEGCLSLAVVALVFMFVPNEFNIPWSELYMEQNSRGIMLTINSLSVIAATFVAPFYVASGFSLYLNRRVNLEGWDIEIAFRKIARKREEKKQQSKLQGSAAALVLFGALFVVSVSLPSPVIALEAFDQNAEFVEEENDSRFDMRLDFESSNTIADREKDLITEIKQDEAFNVRDIHKRRKIPWNLDWLFDKDVDEEKTPPNVEWLVTAISIIVQFAEWILWIAVISLMLYIVFKYHHWLKAFYVAMPKQRSRRAPSVLFGMNVTEESLPSNVGESAESLWSDERHRESLSLLYRACLVQLILRGADLDDGDTERFCVNKAKSIHKDQRLPQNAMEYFERLTQFWQRLAYGHLALESDQVLALCRSWETVWRQSDTEGAS
ncbi:MAG: hypothetical protein K6L80_10730 [Agarilytica sp.]